MLINQQTLDRLCNLSNIKLTDEEKEKFLPQLESVLQYVGELQKIDTEDINLDYKVIRSSMQINSEIIENKDNMLQNVHHPIKNNQIVIQSPIKH